MIVTIITRNRDRTELKPVVLYCVAGVILLAART